MPHKFFFIVLLAGALCACKDNPAKVPPIERHKLDGVILALDPNRQVAKISGQKIEGWMEAMTMEYPVKDQREFDTLHVGDRITATVFVQELNYWIGETSQVR